VVLIIIIFVISLLGLVPKLLEKPAKKEETVAAPVETAPVVEEELADDMELVAVIAAAIAAYEGTSTDGFKVRSIKRANTNKWKRA
jgi:sodium pump decarboxylase gamma subunit